jgi:hypothetical protein
VPTITASDQIRKQDTYQVTLFFDDLLGYDNEGDADLTLQIDKWAALQQYATAFIQRLNLIKQSILPNYLFIPEPPQFTFDSFVGIQRLVTVQVNFNLVVPTNCEVTVKRVIELVGNAIATATTQGNIFLSTRVSAFIECKATATGFIVTGQQNIIEVDASVTAFALASGDIVRVQNVSATTIATATAQADVQRAVNIIGELNATGQVSGNINLTIFTTGSATGTATVDANLDVTTQGIVECEANVTGTSVTSGSLFVIRTLEAQSVAEATSQSQIILSKLLSGVASGFAVAEGNIQRVISVDSSIDTTVTTSAEAQITIPVTAQATATAETSSEAQITRIISAEATATANSSAEANFGITFNAGIEATANVVNADLFRAATLAASITGTATVTGATLDVTASTVTVDYLVVAGGGGGGSYSAGGGGAGGYRTSTGTSGGGGSAESALILNLNQAYSLIVGGGGNGGLYPSRGVKGSDSKLENITSVGGGQGGTSASGVQNGLVGGSGGGGAGQGWNSVGGSGTSLQGFAGGKGLGGTNPAFPGGGGGGAGSAGLDNVNNVGGTGGNGVLSNNIGTALTRGGGGGGGAYTGGTGGLATGGGGAGAGGSGNGSPGTANTGGGGGGGAYQFDVGGMGGSGVVIIKISDSRTATFTGGVTGTTPVVSGGFKVYTITATSNTLQTVTFT